MNCPNCGTPLTSTASICRGCGVTVLPSSREPDRSEPEAVRVSVIPSRSPSGVVDADAPFDQEVWAAVIGPRNTAYYLRRFEAQLTRGRVSRWNWAALFMTTPWLIYRKMPGWALGYLLAPLVLGPLIQATIAVAAWFSGQGVVLLIANMLALVGFLAYWLLPPMFANSVYFDHCRELIRRESLRAENREALLQNVARTGGTRSRWLLLAVFVVLVAVALGLASLMRRF